MDICRCLDAYAHRQADIYWSLTISFVKPWSPELRKNSITIDWPSELAELAAIIHAIPERKSGRKKAKDDCISDSENEEGTVESISFGGSHLESDTESLVGGEDSISGWRKGFTTPCRLH
jgi:hypothetical protein